MIAPRESAPEVEPGPDRPAPVNRLVSIAGTVLGLAILAAAAGLAVFGVIAIYPDDVTKPTDADFLDNIFANEFVLFAARLVLFSAALVAFFTAGYIILSVIKWIGNGQWLRRAGPFEVAEAVTTLNDQIDFWRGLAESTGEELEAMRERLQETDSLAGTLWERINALENTNDELRTELQTRPPG